MAGRFLSIIIIGVLIGVWFLFGSPLLHWLTASFGVLTSYSLFLLLYLYAAYKLGFILNISRFKIVAISLILIIVPDILVPPYLISYDHPPSVEIMSLSSSDTYMYLIWQHLGLSHFWTWFCTYVVTTFLGIGLLAYIMGVNRGMKVFGNRVLDGVPKIR